MAFFYKSIHSIFAITNQILVMRKEIIKLESAPGYYFPDVAARALAIAKQQDTTVEFDFNEINCRVNKDTNIEHLFRDYSNAHVLGWNAVGPICYVEYPDFISKAIDTYNEQLEKKSEEARQEQERKDNSEKAEFEKKVEGIEIEFSDKQAYDDWKAKNTDPYGACCFEYAEGWAKLMQAEIRNGKHVKDVAKDTSYQMNFLGITGLMYGMAVSILAKCWRHGEELRKWHNGEYGQEDSEGVVNPAMITISTKK